MDNTFEDYLQQFNVCKNNLFEISNSDAYDNQQYQEALISYNMSIENMQNYLSSKNSFFNIYFQLKKTNFPL